MKFDSKQQECKRIRINKSNIQSIDSKACGGRVNANAVVMMYQYRVYSDTRMRSLKLHGGSVTYILLCYLNRILSS